MIARLFIAIPLPENVINIVREYQSMLSEDFRPVRIDQVHLSIAFLGELLGSEDIVSKLQKVRYNKFNLKTKGYGFFPSDKKIRVIWIGLEENQDFMNLQHDTRKNFNFREKLMPHITIARAKSLITDNETHWKNTLLKIKYDEAEFIVDRFILFESVPCPKGYEHKELAVFESE
ncbi:RNA 2',3'-cyclic phosphodiesterase [Candidatus Woesearchaeota archaeon]|nr:RNA 2',3'-cyclic phosphodiesterase [Candidatus Woesearchaeota archaeon]